METLRPIFQKAQDGDVNAYGIIVQRFQDMAVGYGYAILGDFHLAEDVAQEAFVEAYQHITKVSSPFAFPGWLRKILFKHCDRYLRRRRLDTVSMDTLVTDVPSNRPPPDVEVEDREMKETIKRGYADAAGTGAHRGLDVLYGRLCS